MKQKHRVRRREGNRQKILEYLGGEYKCSKCGFTSPHSIVFDWHHRDTEDKVDKVSRLLTKRWEVLERELDKCDLLCCRCHRLEHAVGGS